MYEITAETNGGQRPSPTNELYKTLYVEIDASKERGFGVHVYHVKNNPERDDFPKTDAMSILFLSKSLNGAESRYWPTELEVVHLNIHNHHYRNIAFFYIFLSSVCRAFFRVSMGHWGGGSLCSSWGWGLARSACRC